MTAIRRLQDIQIGNDNLIESYRNYFENNNIDAAHDLINTNTLKSYVLNAEWMNSSKSVIEDLEEPKAIRIDNVLTTDSNLFQTSVNNLIYLQEYESTTQYYKGNFVLYDIDNKIYFCILDSLGNVPTNITYWLEIGLLGEKGYQSLGINYKGEWDISTQYYIYDFVYYQNGLYVANANNIGEEPHEPGWFLSNTEYLNNTKYLGSMQGLSWYLIAKSEAQPIHVFPNDYTQLLNGSIFFEKDE